MQLIIAAKSISVNDPFTENFNTYKYRKEVSLLTDLPENELPKITAAAYAFVYPAFFEGTIIPLLQATQCEVPVVVTNTPAVHEIMQDTVLYADPANFEDIADKMMLLFKDENRRSELINQGKLLIRANSYSHESELIWEIINKTAGS